MAEMLASDGKVDAVGTSAGFENEITEAVCKGCSKTFKPSLLYRCNTCVGSSASSSDDNIVEYFCRLCIVWFHLKQKHEIIDERGYPPAICEDHENICNLFCKDCDIVMCNCCVDDHSTHTLGSVREKEIEVRKEIFEMITKNENSSKPLKEKQMIVNEYLAKLNEVIDDVKLENIADTLCRKFETAIRANSETWVKEYLRIPEDALKGYQNCQSEAESLSGVLDRADEAMVTMRDILKTSDGVCVDGYLKCRKELKSSLLEQDELIKKVFHLEECKDIDEIIEESAIKVFKQIRIPVFSTGCEVVLKLRSVIISKTRRKVNYGSGHLSAFRGIENVSDFINIHLYPDLLEIDSEPHYSILRVLRENDGKFTQERIQLQERHVGTVLCHGNYAALRGRDDQLAIVDLCSGAIFRCHPFSTNDFDLLYFACCSLDTFILVLWLHGDLVKKFYSLQSRQPLHSFELKHVRRPKCVAASADLTVFVDHVNSVHIVKDKCDRKRTLIQSAEHKMMIQSAEHKMSQIDNLMFMEESTLVLFDYEERRIITLKIPISFFGGLIKWQVANAVKVSLPCSDEVTEFGFFNDSKVFAVINDKLFVE